MADDEVKWEATSSGQTTLFFSFLFFFSLYFKSLHLTVISPKLKRFTYVTPCPCAEFLSIWEWNVEWDAILIPEWNQDVRWAL